mmetsp:Transcript_6899/g.16725  ORF Transcript_6899/g.16725 Transcript_6899/m.16725 type:complete len:80 (-) Transcript_6899:1531-1770(-)
MRTHRTHESRHVSIAPEKLAGGGLGNGGALSMCSQSSTCIRTYTHTHTHTERETDIYRAATKVKATSRWTASQNACDGE